jgi:hypothetical protein
MSTIIFFEIFNSYLQTASKNFIKFKRHVHILYSSYNNVCFFVFFSIIYNIYFDHVYISIYIYIRTIHKMLPIILYITNIYDILYEYIISKSIFIFTYIYMYHLLYIYTHDSLTFTNHHPLPFFTTSFLLRMSTTTFST